MVAQPTARHTGETTTEAAFRRQVQAKKDGVCISHVAREYGEFRPTGTSRLIGRCLNPNHEDRRPSMTIYTDSQKFKCFSCGVHGDVIDLEMLIDPGLEIQDAMTSLALRYGIELPARPQSWFARQERQKPLRDQMKHTQIEHIRMLVYRLVWVPWLKRLPEWVQDEAEESAWRDSLRMAELLYVERGSA